MIISIDAEKALEKTQHPLLILELEKDFPHLIKDIYKKPETNMKMRKCFPSKIGKR